MEILGGSRAQTPPVPSPDRPPRLRRGEAAAAGPAEDPRPPGRCPAAAGGPSRARGQRPGPGAPAQTGREGCAGCGSIPGSPALTERWLPGAPRKEHFPVIKPTLVKCFSLFIYFFSVNYLVFGAFFCLLRLGWGGVAIGMLKEGSGGIGDGLSAVG